MFTRKLAHSFAGKVKSLIHEGFLWPFLKVLLLALKVFQECEHLLFFPPATALIPTWHLLFVLLGPTSEKAMAPHASTLASHGWRSLVGCSPWGH